MLQPYGIDLIGDLGGSVFTIAVFAAVYHFVSARAAYGWLVLSAVLALAGSLPIVVLAVLRGDFYVSWYHAFWVVGCVHLTRWAWRRRRDGLSVEQRPTAPDL